MLIFFRIPLVKFFLHLFIVALIGYNIHLNYTLFQTTKQKIEVEKNLKILNQENISLQDKSDYYKSSIFKEKSIKEDGLIKQGEKAIRLGVRENVSFDKNDTSFIKAPEQASQNNIEKWLECFGRESVNVNNFCR